MQGTHSEELQQVRKDLFLFFLHFARDAVGLAIHGGQ
jgi:hypothetical protein